MNAATPLLELDKLAVSFDGHAAVHPIDLAIERGEMLALVGESGSGKSTIALATMGLLPSQARVQGAIRFEGQSLLGQREREWSALRGNRVSMIFQEPMTSLNPLQPVGRQVAEALTLHRPMSSQAARNAALELLDLVRLPEPSRRFDSYPHELSGGQRQRVMIAIAVACRPGLLIADEPTTALDVTIQAQILELIDSLRRELAMTVLLITHDLGVVSRWADRVIVMKDGAKVEEATSAALFAQPKQPYTRALLGASLHFGAGLHYSDTRLTEVHCEERRPSVDPSRVLLEAKDVCVDYRAVRAVDGVSFDVRAGETVGLVGESGCGKSSLSGALTRLIEPTRGSIVFDGEDVTHQSRHALRPYRRRVQMIFQDPYGSLNPRHTVERTLGLALSIHGVSARRERDAKIRRIVDAVGLPASALRR
ncbi:oligopeptide/dipeptide ABC transporter ATPase [Caballeronia arationis]|nr:oligopeptide/dipeptide ABC transporter ATPase [Caballeronia arationis]